METRSRKRKLLDDIKPVVMPASVERIFTESTYNLDAVKDDIDVYFAMNNKKIKVEYKNEKSDINLIKKESKLSQSCGITESSDTVSVKVQCFKCENYFSKTGYTRHTCRTFCCDKCGKGFTNRSKFKSHLRQHAIIERRQELHETTVCKVCNQIQRSDFIKRHMLIHKTYRTCGKCRVTLREKEMRAHVKTHYKFTCTVCGKKNKQETDHERHMKLHEKEKNYQCDECRKSFQHLVELARHVTIVHRHIETGKYECLFCKKIVSAIGHHLRTHQIDYHTCSVCNAQLRNKSALKEHLRQHQILKKKGNDRPVMPKNVYDQNRMPRNCPICERTFCSGALATKHFLKNHFQFSSYPCLFCEAASFDSVLEFIDHFNVVHRDNYLARNPDVAAIDLHSMVNETSKDIQCEKCGMLFSSDKIFWKHYNRRHRVKKIRKSMLHILMEKYSTLKLNFKKVPCLQCHRKIPISHVSSHLACHRTFKCLMCEKGFSNQQSLKLHEISHERINKALKCPLCSLTFLSHIRLMAHLKRYHKMAYSASRACPRCIFVL